MASDTASSVEEQAQQLVAPGGLVGGEGGGSTDKRGRHRILAELSRLEQELKFLQDELGELERTENVSTICSGLLPYVEDRPDPLLPLTNGPVNLVWDRWFEGPQDSQSCSCWIL
ncbi:guanine nucleotide-binding protein subunit gamma 1-like [Pyrus ussuriensis x Pyrus communis]|uniref:Guanine nucleotide-binding protein subunit gamma 1-like n=1 Tax=Pyrus ussuriensis x Pyrus communis TaxID=2448454 RepID=A0A5N5FQX0_9ROSA|nr:guanine nucleotide-binding protein subunit gamma 1-like [Pyrus ussuriensis x Pyrus communis]